MPDAEESSCEKFRNEFFHKIHYHLNHKAYLYNMTISRITSSKENPFKFGTIVDEPYFTDRTEELHRIEQFLGGENSLILISPRRYGKSSLARKAVKEIGRPYVWVNMQQVVSREDLAVKLLKAIFKQYKFEKVKYLLSNFRVLPTININPLTDEMSVSFQPMINEKVVLEDSLGLLEKVSSPGNRLIVVFDEFQDVLEIDSHIDKELRSILQEQTGLNYIFLGSQESMMTDIFERPKSPFYHFGQLMRLDKIPAKEFSEYIEHRFAPLTDKAHELATGIIAFTDNHPYYSQQLAFTIWDLMALGFSDDDIIGKAVSDIVQAHDLDYERLWLTFNKTDQLIVRLVCEQVSPVRSRVFPTSTITSSLRRLMKRGYVIRESRDNYTMEDPFFKEWIKVQQA